MSHLISESLGCCMEAEHCCIALDERDSCVLVAARMYYTGQADSELNYIYAKPLKFLPLLTCLPNHQRTQAEQVVATEWTV